MAHRRSVQPARVLEQDELTSAMIGIGMSFGGRATRDPNIEDTLLGAAVVGLDEDDLRVLAMLTTWFGIHSSYVIASRLAKIVAQAGSDRVRAYFAALATWRSSDHRFAPLASLWPEKQVNLLEVGGEFQIRRRGEDHRFTGGPLRVPAGVLRDRSEDVLSPDALAKHHRAYHWRVVMGPTFRADMWAALEADPGLRPAELARRAYGSYATAWRVRRDAAVLLGSNA